MVNVEEFAKRIQILLDYYEISASVLAEKIDVQRSSISHILSGRNKPSLDFVLKILKAFPDVELYWLLNGIGTFPSAAKKETTSLPPVSVKEHSATLVKDQNQFHANETEIDRIVVFFKDGTFKNYKP
jgi:transcriptional regulator with XRE-family HTH domain